MLLRSVILILSHFKTGHCHWRFKRRGGGATFSTLLACSDASAQREDEGGQESAGEAAIVREDS